ncbi:hypothetical protein pipiens_018742 [Culex pipiens pipiens]|uniref:TEP1-F n=1 Tax=Culex pipiens pipiens TaxID=38569 RepID=A0ABD1E2U5_CULPP
MSIVVKYAIFGVLVSGAGFVRSYYVALIPKTIREHSSSLVVIANLGFDHDEQFRISQNGKAKLVDVPVNVTMTVKPKLLNGRNAVQVVDTRSGVTTDLDVTMDRSSLSIYIQTDKPIYKPGDTIRFRVLVLDHELKPSAMLKSIKVRLADSQENLIREWSFGELVQGVFQSELELANFVRLGTWILTATVMNGKAKSKEITVDEYVLPKHEIRMSSSKIAVMTDETLTLVVDAVYTFGKPIRGDLTVIAEDSGQEVQNSINGRTIVNFDVASLVEGQHFGKMFYITFTATIAELGTDQQYKKSVHIPIYRDSHRITFRKSSENLTPGVYFRCWFTVTDPSGNPFQKPDNLIVKATQGKTTITTKKPDQNGVVYLKFDDIDDYSQSLKLDVSYAGKTHFFSVEPLHEDDSFIQVSILTEDPDQGEPVKVLVTSSFDLNPFLYFVIARGEILTRARIHAKAGQKSTFSFPVTLGMVPSASVVVFAVHEGRLMQDVAHFRVTRLKNFVNVTLSEHETEPRRQLQIRVDSLPGSMVGLLAVDKSVLLLGTGNDITRQSLQEDGIDMESKDIEDLGLTVLTNAKPSAKLSGEVDIRICDDDYGGHVRKHFPETWLWTEPMAVSSSGSLSLTASVPDTITGWSISAFAANAQHGLGLIEQPISLTVVKPFFVTVNVAYSILKTEIALIEVFVYNYGVGQEHAEVTLQVDSEEFLLLNEEQQVIGGVRQSERVSVPVDGIETVQFFAKPRRSGELTITVTAKTNSNKFDGVQRTVKVTSGGIQFYQNEARFIEVEDAAQRFDIGLAIPRTATNGSELIEFSLEGLVMGAALTNLDGLIRLPTGCGEQRLVKLVPTAIALEYMSVTGTLGDSMKYRAVAFLRQGYQNQLEYKRKDGSFHVFVWDDHGSLMVTAIVAKTLRIAGKYITVDEGIARNAYDWIQRQQRSDGSFSEAGRVISRRMQGSLGDDVPLTAFTLIAILEHKNLAQKYRTVVEKGTSYLSKKLGGLTKPYHLAMVAYALQLAKHNRKQFALEKLIEISKNKDNMRWWQDGEASIETTAYALLTYLNNGMYIDAGPLMKWLVSKRYDLGGFDNTQNTLIGLQALAEYSKLLSPSRNNYEVTVSYGDGNRNSLKIQGMTTPISQSLILPANTRKVNVLIVGTGTGVFQVAYQYNQIATDDEPRFELSKTIRRSSSGSVLDLNICAKFKPRKRFEVTNMVLMEVLLPSGYVVADKTIDKLRNNKKVMKIEKDYDDTRLVLYFDSLSDVDATCVEVFSLRKAVVLGQIAGMIKVYDYYDPDREAYEYFDANA